MHLEGDKTIWGILAKSAFCLILFFVFSNTAQASFNPQINYQGKLTNTSNTAVPDDSYNMKFRLCDDSSCTTQIWIETRTGSDMVPVNNGLFSVMLGDISDISTVNFNQTLYLEVSIGGTSTPSWEIMLPRKKFGAVPAAFEALKLGGLTSSEYAVLANNETVSGTWAFNNNLSVQGTATLATTTISRYLAINTSTLDSTLVIDNGTASYGGFDYANYFKSGFHYGNFGGDISFYSSGFGFASTTDADQTEASNVGLAGVGSGAGSGGVYGLGLDGAHGGQFLSTNVDGMGLIAGNIDPDGLAIYSIQGKNVFVGTTTMATTSMAFNSTIGDGSTQIQVSNLDFGNGVGSVPLISFSSPTFNPGNSAPTYGAMGDALVIYENSQTMNPEFRLLDRDFGSAVIQYVTSTNTLRLADAQDYFIDFRDNYSSTFRVGTDTDYLQFSNRLTDSYGYIPSIRPNGLSFAGAPLNSTYGEWIGGLIITEGASSPDVNYDGSPTLQFANSEFTNGAIFNFSTTTNKLSLFGYPDFLGFDINTTTTLSRLSNSYLAVDEDGVITATNTPVVIESDPVWLSASSSYLTLTSASSTYLRIDSASTTFWDTAYGWGDHADAGYLTGNQNITLSGDVTGSGTTSISVAITNSAVSLAKMANLAYGNIIGRSTDSTGAPEAISTSTYKTMLALVKGDIGLGSVENTALSTWAGTSNITTLGTIATGVWNGTDVAVADGGTGASTLTGLLQGNGTSAITAITGTAGQVPYFNGTNTVLATSSLFIDSVGQVGIGTTTPSSRLHITGMAGTDILTISSSSNDKLFIIDSSGNIGLKTTTTPAYNIQAIGAFVVSEKSGLAGNGTVDSNTALLLNNAGGQSYVLSYAPDVFNLGTRWAKDLAFKTDNTERMRLASDGQLIVGTSTDLLEPSAVGSYGNNLFINDASKVSALVLGADRGDSELVIGDLIGFTTGNTIETNRRVSLIRSSVTGSTAGNRGGQLQFYTKSDGGGFNTPMTITNAANVGIGTTTPRGKVDVVKAWGDGGPSDVSLIFGQDNTGNGYNIYGIGHTLNSGWDRANDTGTLFLNYRGYQGGVDYYRDVNISNGKARSIALFDGSTGYVGIGTTTPSEVLNVYGNLLMGGTALIRGDTFQSSATSYNKLDMENGSNFLLSSRENGIFSIDSDNGATGNYFDFQNNANTGSGTSLVRITDAGYVGIGTTNPSVSLDVAGQGYFFSETYPPLTVSRSLTGTNASYGVLKLMASTSADMADNFGAHIDFNILDSAQVENTVGRVGTIRNGADNIGALVFQTANGSTPTEKMRITGAGNVGIGTTTPLSTSRLNVLSDNTTGGIVVTAVSGQSASFNTYTSGTLSGVWCTAGTTNNCMTGAAAGELIIRTDGQKMRLGTSYSGSGSSNAMIIGTNGYIGIGTTTPGTLLQVGGPSTSDGNQVTVRDTNGTCVINPTTSGTGWSCSSDVRLKEGIVELQDALSQVMSLRPVSYIVRSDGSEGIGFIAQEMQVVMPDAVTTLPDGYLAVDPVRTIPRLVGAIQEQQRQIDDLQNLINSTSSVAVVSGDSNLFATLTVVQAANFNGTITVIGEAGFTSKVTFRDHIYLDKDSAGKIKIPAGATSTEIVFAKPYETVPVINITARSNTLGRNYWVENETTTGFRIAVDNSFDNDFEFNWQAVAVFFDVDDVVSSEVESVTIDSAPSLSNILLESSTSSTSTASTSSPTSTDSVSSPIDMVLSITADSGLSSSTTDLSPISPTDSDVIAEI